MKRSTMLIVTGLVLLFLATLYAIMPAFSLHFYRSRLFIAPEIFVWSYWLCHFAGIGCLATGVRELWKEK